MSKKATSLGGGIIPVEFTKVGSIGVVQDREPRLLPPVAWTDSRNIRFRNDKAIRMEGNKQVFGAPSVTPYAIFNVPGTNDQSFWFYFSLTKAYVVESGVHTDVTRAGGGGGDYATVNGRTWTGCILAGIPIFNNGVDKPQYWSALSVGTKLDNLPNFPAATKPRVIRNFGPYLIAINLTEGGINKPHKVLISHKADPGSVPSSWDDTDPTVDAISFELTDTQGGELLDGLPLGSSFIFYKKNSAHLMRFVGGSNVWGTDRLFERSGILNTRCVCSFKEGTFHFVVTQNDIIVHAGVAGSSQSVVEGTNRQAIFAELDAANYFNSFVFDNKQKSEVWFVYPTQGNSTPNKVYFYNYASKASGFRDISALSADLGVFADSDTTTWDSDSSSWDSDLSSPWQATGRESFLYVSPDDVKIYQLDSGLAFGTSTPLAYLERKELVYESDHIRYGQEILISRIWMKTSGNGKWTVKVGGVDVPDGSITWSNTATFDPALQIPWLDIDPPVACRLPAIRFEQNENVSAELHGYDLHIAALGEF
jgi:hypothetical protein